jgi:orotidine-5'-phosphate decarboxylase
MTSISYKSSPSEGSLLPKEAHSLERRRIKNRTGIIHALDVEDLARAKEIAVEVEPYVDAVKLSWPLIMVNGARAIASIKSRIRLPIIACFKVADIPEVSSKIVDYAIKYGADGITLHGMVGRDTIGECINVAHKYDAMTWMVTEMSHPGAEEFMQPFGEKVAQMARELGSDGIVAPATRPNRTRRYREIIGGEIRIMSPGIGAQGGQIGDAIKAGADYEIIGRRIWNTSNPAAEAKKFADALAQVKKHMVTVK